MQPTWENMRNIESITIKKAILHVLDKDADEPILANLPQEITEDIHEFLEKHIVKSLKSEENKKAYFQGGQTIVKDACKNMFADENNFVESSKVIAKQLFKAMKRTNNPSSADLVIVLYKTDARDYISILKLDYKKSFIHSIEYVENGYVTSITPQSIGLPSMGQKLQKCAFIRKINEENEYDLILLDKQSPSEKDEISLYFKELFLNCELVVDSRDKTKAFKKTTERFIRKHLKDDLDLAQEAREEVIERLQNSIEVDVENFAHDVFGGNSEIKEKYIQQANKVGLGYKSFDIDKGWVEKKMKKRSMKTDTGFEVKGEFENFDDKMKFEMTRNGDGTVNLIIKNIHRINE